jgi:hypothetical protein
MFSDKIWLILQKLLRNTFFKGIVKRAQITEIPAFFEKLGVTYKKPRIIATFGPKNDIFAIDICMYPDFRVNKLNGVLGMLKSNIKLKYYS